MAEHARKERDRAQKLADAIWHALNYLPNIEADDDYSVPYDVLYARTLLEDAHRDAMQAALEADADTAADGRQGREW